MGFGGIGIWQLLIVLAIVLLIFGGKRLRNLGGDLGGAIKGFKKVALELLGLGMRLSARVLRAHVYQYMYV